MKPFDLEKAKTGAKLCTRDGRRARIICYDRKSKVYPIVALINEDVKDEYIRFYTLQGECDVRIKENEDDLFLAPEKKEGWVNVFATPCGIKTGCVYPTKESALNCNELLANRVDTVKIEWEE